MAFYTRPNFEDRQVVQYSGTSITLSGTTNLGHTGSIKAKSGGLIQIDNGGTFQVVDGAVYGYVLTADSLGRASWGPVSGTSSGTLIFTGNTSATCVSNFYVQNINSCSPLHIQNFSSGDVYLVENGNGNVGINTSSPSARLHVKGVNSNSSNYGLKIQNSGTTDLLTIRNDATVSIGGDSGYSAPPSEGGRLYIKSPNANFDTIGSAVTLKIQRTDGNNVLSVDDLGLTNSNAAIRLNLGSNSNNNSYINTYSVGGLISLNNENGNQSLFFGNGITNFSFLYSQNTNSGRFVNINPSIGNWIFNTPNFDTSSADANTKVTIYSSGNTSSKYGLKVATTVSTGPSTFSITDLLTVRNDGVVAIGVIPTLNNSATQFLTRNSSTGNIEYRDYSSFSATTSTGGGTFTGNTSASCISNLYVSNLHGCSPITVHDQFQHVGSTSSGILSTAFGYQTQAIGDYSFATGVLTQSVGTFGSHSQGYQTQALARGCHAEGSNTIAGVTGLTGRYSHAEGVSTQALATASHAEGENTIAWGEASHAEGNGSKTGIYGYSASGGCTNGVIILDPTYGDVTGDFTSPYIAVYDLGANTNQGYVLSGTPVLYNIPSTYIYLNNISTNIGNAIVVGIPQTYQPTNSDTIIYGNQSSAKGESTLSSGFNTSSKGYNTHAIGDKSSVEGRNTISLGLNSHSEGNGTIAIGESSHTEGDSTIASGLNSHAEGFMTTASGNYSHAEGSVTTASGVESHAEGKNTTSSGQHSHAEGDSSISYGEGSHAEGHATLASDYWAHAEGDSTTAAGFASHTEGSGTTVTSFGLYSHAEGYGTVNGGLASHTEGGMTNIDKVAYYAHAEGYGSQVLGGIGGHSEGYYSSSYGDYAHSQNAYNSAIGVASHAGGSGSTSGGDYSFVHSYNSSINGHGTFMPTGGDRNVILGGKNHQTIGNNDSHTPSEVRDSIIIGGSDNKIISPLGTNVTNTVVLGGSNVTATTSNAVYIPTIVLGIPDFTPTGSTDPRGVDGQFLLTTGGKVLIKIAGAGWRQINTNSF